MNPYKEILRKFFSEYVRTLRKCRGLTQEEMAEKLRISGRAYSDLERGIYCFSTVALVFLLVAALLTKAMEAVSLGWLNRWLGAGLGALKFLLLVSLLICVVEFIDSDNTMIDRTMKEESVLYYPIESFAGMFFPAAKEVTEQYILNT